MWIQLITVTKQHSNNNLCYAKLPVDLDNIVLNFWKIITQKKNCLGTLLPSGKDTLPIYSTWINPEFQIESLGKI